jgi:predicted unusual protein kinase regulating ubiquinone biosynthesis (AarF/ABC1/UbiB family)
MASRNARKRRNRSDRVRSAPPPGALGELSALTRETLGLSRGLVPLARLLASEHDVTRDQLAQAIDRLFVQLYRHPLVDQTGRVTQFLRSRRLIPNEQSTEELIRYVVDQLVARSPVQVPPAVIDEFWNFFDELFSSPELKGLGELTLDMARLVLRTYEPQLVELVNLLKVSRRFSAWQRDELMKRLGIVRRDVAIMRRQIRALRHIRPFFQTDPRDFRAQAQIVAQMVREFGPFFVKMAQAAAANADFLPEDIARELEVFHEDVPPMGREEVLQAFRECYGQAPDKLYMGFDPDRPIRSGSIGSIYLAKKPFMIDGQEVLQPVIIKVGRHNIDREFAIGKLVLGLAIMSSQYWAPHSKLAPFLRAMQEQVDEFIAGFQQELNFQEEARIQSLFYERSRSSVVWRVPALYHASHRILEMQYLGDASSLTRALDRLPLRKRRRFQRRLSERFLYTVLYHVFFYRECHGDLHPGNIMVDRNGDLYLIDWGNSVQLDGKWPAVWRYLVGAVLADPERLADALIEISTQPEANFRRRREIQALLRETLQKKRVETLRRSNFLWLLARGGWAGLRRRGQAVLHLMSNTQHLGLVVRSDYLHLSRSLFAAAGSFASIYEGGSRLALWRDLFLGLGRFPWMLTRDKVDVRVQRLRDRVLEKLPLPGVQRRYAVRRMIREVRGLQSPPDSRAA